MEKTKFTVIKLVLLFLAIFSLSLMLFNTGFAVPDNDESSEIQDETSLADNNSNNNSNNNEVAKNDSVEGLTILKNDSPAIIDTDYTFDSSLGWITILSPDIKIIQNNPSEPLDYRFYVSDASTVSNLTLVDLCIVHTKDIFPIPISLAIFFPDGTSASEEFNLNISGECFIYDSLASGTPLVSIRGNGGSVSVNGSGKDESTLELSQGYKSITSDYGIFDLNGANVNFNNVLLSIQARNIDSDLISLSAANNSTITMNGNTSLKIENPWGGSTTARFKDVSSLVLNDYSSVSLDYSSENYNGMLQFEGVGSGSFSPLVLDLNDHATITANSKSDSLCLYVSLHGLIQNRGHSEMNVLSQGRAIGAEWTNINILDNSSLRVESITQLSPSNGSGDSSFLCNSLFVNTSGEVVVNSNRYGIWTNGDLKVLSGVVYVDAEMGEALVVEAGYITVSNNAIVYLTSGEDNTVWSNNDNFIIHEDDVQVLGSDQYECSLFETSSETVYVYDKSSYIYKIICVDNVAAKTVVIRSATNLPEPYGLTITKNSQKAIPGEDYTYDPFTKEIDILKRDIAISQKDHNETLYYHINWTLLGVSTGSLTLENLNFETDKALNINIYKTGDDTPNVNLNILGNCEIAYYLPEEYHTKPLINIKGQTQKPEDEEVPVVNINGIMSSQGVRPSLALKSSFNPLYVHATSLSVCGSLDMSIDSRIQSSIFLSNSPAFSLNDNVVINLSSELGQAITSSSLGVMELNDNSKLNAASDCRNVVDLADEEDVSNDGNIIQVNENACMNVKSGYMHNDPGAIHTTRTIRIDTSGNVDINTNFPSAIIIDEGDLVIANGTFSATQEETNFNNDLNADIPMYISLDKGNIIIGDSENNSTDVHINSLYYMTAINTPEGSLSILGNSSLSCKILGGVYEDYPAIQVKDFYEETTKGVSIVAVSSGIKASNNIDIKSGYLSLNCNGSSCLYAHNKIKIHDSQSVYLTTYTEGQLAVKSNIDEFMDNGVEVKIYGSKAAQTEPEDVVLPVKYFKLEDGTYTLAVQDEQSSNAPTPAKTILAKTEHNLDLVEGQSPTYNDAGWKDYYECTTCGNCYVDAEATMLIEDLEAWKTDPNGGYLPPYSIAFEQYRENILLACDNLLLPTDDDFIKVLIAEAKKAIDAYSYSDEISLDENKQELDKIYNKLVEDINNFRNQQQQGEEINAAAQTSDNTALLTVLILLLISTTLFITNTKFNRSIK